MTASRLLAAALLLPFLLMGPCHAAAPREREVMVPLTGAIDGESLRPVQDKLDELAAAGAKRLVMQINSPGGSIGAGWDFVGHLRDLKRHGVRVSCFVDWQASSMAAVILESACDDRWAAPNAFILFHEGAAQLSGHADELEAEARILRTLNKTMASTVGPRLGMTAAKYLARIHQGDWTMSAQDALDAHAIDAIKDPSELPPLAELAAPDPMAGIRRLLAP